MGIHQNLNRMLGFPSEESLGTRNKTQGWEHKAHSSAHSKPSSFTVLRILVCNVPLNQGGSDEDMD